MGLFGFIMGSVGLGAMIKDHISREFTAESARQNAEINNSPWYLTGNGAEMRSTATGRRASQRTDLVTKHEWLVDFRTGERIEDLTLLQNKKKTEQNRYKAHSQGKRFYRTAMFDIMPYAQPMIYVCDDFPGLYFDKHTINHGTMEIFGLREIEPDEYKKGSYKFKYKMWRELPNWYYNHNLDKVNILGESYNEG